MESIVGSALTFLNIDSKQMPMNQGALYVFSSNKAHLPDIENFQNMIANRITGNHCLRQRIIEPLFKLANPIWLQDPHFDINFNVREVKLPEKSSQNDLMQLISELGAEKLDRGSPLWRIYLIPLIGIKPYPGHSFAIYTVVHKSVEKRLSKPLLNELFSRPTSFGISHSLMEELNSEVNTQNNEESFSLMRWIPEAFPSRNELLSKAKDDLFSLPKQGSKIAKKLVKSWAQNKIADNITSPEEAPPRWFCSPQSVFNKSFGVDRLNESVFWPAGEMNHLIRYFKDTQLSDLLLLISGQALRIYLSEENQLPQQPLIALTTLKKQLAKAGTQSLLRLPTLVKDPILGLHKVREQRKLLKEYFSVASSVSTLSQLPPRLISASINTYTKSRMHRFHQPAFNLLISIEEEPESLKYFNHFELSQEAKFGELYPGIGLHLYFIINQEHVSINFTSNPQLINSKSLEEAFQQAKDLFKTAIHRQPMNLIKANRKLCEKNKEEVNKNVRNKEANLSQTKQEQLKVGS